MAYFSLRILVRAAIMNILAVSLRPTCLNIRAISYKRIKRTKVSRLRDVNKGTVLSILQNYIMSSLG